MRARRLAAILTIAAYAVPWTPWLIHTPRARYNDYGAGAGCALLSATLIFAAFVAACFGAREGGGRNYWSVVAAVGLWWFIALAFVPVY